jgi:hypothetical protein
MCIAAVCYVASVAVAGHWHMKVVQKGFFPRPTVSMSGAAMVDMYLSDMRVSIIDKSAGTCPL